MNYLTGPLTRTQIPDLNKLVGADRAASSTHTCSCPDHVLQLGKTVSTLQPAGIRHTCPNPYHVCQASGRIFVHPTHHSSRDRGVFPAQ